VIVEPGYTIPDEILAKLGDGDIKVGRRVLRTLIDLHVAHIPVNGPTERPADVRVANIEDEVSLVELLKIDIQENAAHIAPISDRRLWTFVQNATRDLMNLGAARPMIGVIGSPGQIEGAVFLSPAQWFWSEDWFLEERLIAVRPEFRGSRHGADLIRFARWCVDTIKADSGYRTYLLSSVVATRNALAKQALFGRMLNRIGSLYAYPNPTISP
jgi:hypothetical protein